jgi:serine/threonine protein kinase
MQLENGSIVLSKNSRENIIEYKGIFYAVNSLIPGKKYSKGGNSSVFKLIDPNDDYEYAIKFSKYPYGDKNKKGNKRFQHEVDALYKAKREGLENVVTIYFDGVRRINNENFHYYVMEKAESDLTDHITNNPLALNQKYVLCYEIIKGVNQLHSINLYHRDIKPDNMFFVDGTWKVGDLGLSRYRKQESIPDTKNEKIGPYGWLSPEVMNKVLCEGTTMENFHNCVIDAFSDIFQLGKLIWYIFNGNIPIGQIKLSDLRVNKSDLFDLIFQMLQYNKSDRGKLEDYEEAFELYIR